MKKERLTEINLLRAIACLAVMVVHITAISIFSDSAGPLTKGIFSFINRSLKFTTPTFIFISGLILYYNYHDRKINYWKFWKKRFKVILGPYLLWNIIYYLYFINRGYYAFSWRFFLEKLLLADMVYHLYFILIILQFYLLFGVFRYLFNKFNSHLLVVLMLAINLIFMKYCYFKYVDRFFMQYLFSFTLGCYFAKNYLFIKEKVFHFKIPIIIIYLGMSLYYTYQFYYIHILGNPFSGFLVNLTWVVFSMVAIVFYFLVTLNITKSKVPFLKNILLKVSDSSYYIYLSHPLMIFISQGILNRVLVYSTTINFLITILMVFGTILPLSFFYKKNKIYVSKYLKVPG